MIPVVVIGLAHLPYLRPNFHQASLEPDLRVMTFIILNQNSDFESVAQLIERYEPDVVALQEVTEEAKTAPTSRLADSFPHLVVGAPNPGGTTAVLSRLPVREIVEVDLGVDRPAVLASGDIDGQPVVVISAHLYPSFYALQ